MIWTRGKALGGSTIINYMIYIRGNKGDYDRWMMAGNKGWSYDEVLPYFKKYEDFLVDIQDAGYHGRGGYLGVQNVPYRTKSGEAFVKAMQEYGYKYVDYNGEHQIGVSLVHATLRNGRRSSALRAYIDSARHRPNLKIITEARVTKILIDPETKTALGVEFVKNKRKFFARTAKEVIISAGALASPQILMLSGIGPKKHLEDLQIPVVSDLPVGEQLYDHLTFLGLVFKVNDSIVPREGLVTSPESIIQFFLRGVGPLTSLGGVEALGIIRTPMSRDSDPDYPDMEFIFVNGGLHFDKGRWLRKTFGVSDKYYDEFYKPLEEDNAFSILPMLYHPKSFGRVKLKNSNPFSWPKFYGNYFTDAENFDVKTFIAAIREAQKLIKMPAFQKYDAKQVDTHLSGCTDFIYDTDEYWECALRHLSTTLHHQVATCKMGLESDGGVVNHELKVFGVKNLRVVDTSIIPIPISAHTNAPAYMVGEKASDIIKNQWMENEV